MAPHVLRTREMNSDERPGKQTDAGETVVCSCLDRTAAEIRDAVERLELETFEELAAVFLAGSGCTSCRPEVESILTEFQAPGTTVALQEDVDSEQAQDAVEKPIRR